MVIKLQNAYGNQAGQYGQSSAGYMGAAGSMFGSAIGLGIEGFGSDAGNGIYQRPSSGVNSWQWSQDQVALTNAGL